MSVTGRSAMRAAARAARGARQANLYRSLLAAIVCIGLAAAARAADCTDELALRDAPIHRVGTYTNMRYTEEHAYGYSVEFWRSGDCWFGLFLASAGLAGDTPTGLIENPKVDSRSAAVSFSARLTMGRLTAKNIDNAVSRDVYRFSGKLNRNSLRGTVRHTNALLPQDPGDSETVVLRRSKKDADASLPAATFREWRRDAQAILERRGPKW